MNKILIVEDDNTIHDMVKEYLRYGERIFK